MQKISLHLSLTLFLLLSVPHILEYISPSETDSAPKTEELSFSSSNIELEKAFKWAKNKALSFAHDNADPVGYWYEAALPNREAFCMRDVSHQAIGAEILGLGQHNYNMFLKFAQNISKEKDYCTFWEINRFNKPAPVDYENDHDFWYNLPANFDLIHSAYRLYKWTGDQKYLLDQALNNFYELSLNQYMGHWDLSCDKILNRNRALHLTMDSGGNRFGNHRGIPTYNEGGRGETLLGIDMTASIIAAYKAYAEMQRIKGNPQQSEKYYQLAKLEQNFLDDFWWDSAAQAYRSILYADQTFDHFMVGDDQAFLHYLFYFDINLDEQKSNNLVDQYEANFEKLIVELKSYLPIIFYEHGRSQLADQMIIDLCSVQNKRRDYPENSFTVIEHLTRGLMGIDVDATAHMFSTLSRVASEKDWAEISNVPFLSNKVTVKHFGTTKTQVSNVSGGVVKWSARIAGTHPFLNVDGRKSKCFIGGINENPYSYVIVELRQGQEATVSVVL